MISVWVILLCNAILVGYFLRAQEKAYKRRSLESHAQSRDFIEWLRASE